MLVGFVAIAIALCMAPCASDVSIDGPADDVSEDEYGTTIAAGTCGTCPWSISEEGALIIEEGVLASNDECSEDFWPWYDQRSVITRVVLEKGVKLGSNLSWMQVRLTSAWLQITANLPVLLGDRSPPLLPRF